MTTLDLTIRRKPVTGIGALVALVLAAGLASPVWAGRPLATEDAGVLGQGECEIESYAGRARSADNDNDTTSWAQLGCGIGRNTQLSFGAGAERAAGETSTIAALGGKTYLRELTVDQTGVVLTYTLLGVKESGNSFKHDATEIKAVVSIPREGWLLHANLGSNFSHTANLYSTVWGLAVERPGAVGPVDLMAEVFGDNHSAAWVQLGARWTVVAERFYLDTSWGVQTDSARAKQITVGLKFPF